MDMSSQSDGTWKIRVTGYPKYTQPLDLVTVFTSYGTPKVEKFSQKFAIISFKTEDEAKHAVRDTNIVNIYGEFLTVRLFTERLEPNTPRKESHTPKRDFTRSKEKGKIIAPGAIELSGDFHSQLDAVLAAVRLAQGEVAALAQLYVDLEQVLQQIWPGCIAMPFGSITTGLGIKTSDADCFISIPPNLHYPGCNYVNRAKKALQQYPDKFTELLAIPRANTPIVKFFHVPTGTNCDLTFKTPLGAQNSKLVAFLLHADPRLIPMAVVIKYWAKVHEFSGTGKLTNYALTLMVLFYLQQPPASLLPAVAWLQKDREEVLVDGWNTGFEPDHDQLPTSTNTSSISELLGGFFQYYSTFNFDEMIVCPLVGSPLTKELFRNLDNLPPELERYVKNVKSRASMPLKFTSSICIQDPLELCHNVASTVTSRTAQEISAYFKFAAAAYDKEKLNNCQDFLSTILLQKPKLPRSKQHTEFRNVYRHIVEMIENEDWKSVIRDIIMTVFEKMSKLKLTKFEGKTNETEGRKKKEKYGSVLTKAIWKRKPFSKLYDQMYVDFAEKQARITDEIERADKQLYNIQFHLTVTFTDEPRSVAVSIKLIDGDSQLYKEFGKFFISVMHNWVITLLQPHFKPDLKKNSKKADSVNDTKKNKSNNEVIETSQVELDDSQEEDVSESNDVSKLNI